MVPGNRRIREDNDFIRPAAEMSGKPALEFAEKRAVICVQPALIDSLQIRHELVPVGQSHFTEGQRKICH
jgi:hypothetical protein